MQFTIRFGKKVRSNLSPQELESRFTRSLHRFRHRVKHVFVFVDDVNGPRGGVDTQCRCVVHLNRLPPVVVQDQDDSLLSLMHRVANRVSYVLSQKTRRISKRFSGNRKPRWTMNSSANQPATLAGEGVS